MKKILLAVSAAVTVVGALMVNAWADKQTDKLPAPVAALLDIGIEVVERFDAPSGLTGFGATYEGRPLAIYLTEDGKHAIVGKLFDSQGQDLTEKALERIVAAPGAEKAWELLENSHWVLDGSADAEVIVYEFTDPNCPFCHKFWKSARPWVEAGKVQIRHVMVGIIRPDSPHKAASILSADNPSEAFARSQERYNRGGAKIADNIPRTAKEQVIENNALMKSLGYFATPTIIYKNKTGLFGVKQGLPQGDELIEIMGSPKP